MMYVDAFKDRQRVALRALDMLEGAPMPAVDAVRVAMDELGYDAPSNVVQMLALHIDAIRCARAGLPWREAQAASVHLAREDPEALYAPLRLCEAA